MLTTSFPCYDGDMAGIFIYEQAKKMVEKGMDVSVVAPHDFETKGYEIREGIKIHRFQYMFPKKYQRIAYHGGVELNLQRSLIAKLELPLFLFSFFFKCLTVSKKCDILHANWTPAGLIAVFLKKIYKKPCILTLHGTDTCDIARGDNTLFHRVLRKTSSYLFSNVNGIILVSDEVGRSIDYCAGIHSNKIRVISNGIDITKFKIMNQKEARKKVKLPLDKRIIIFIGRFVPVKGIVYLIDAIPHIIKETEDVLFVLVGEGYLKKGLMERVEDYRLNNHVVFIDQKQHDEILFWLNSADILILPSLSEGKPTVVLEAMACELPVIATNVGGTSELVKDGKTGFLINPKNPREIAEKIVKLLNDENLRKTMGKNGRQFIESEGLTWENNASEVIKFYEELCA